MKLATYQLDGKQRFGAIFGNNIAELSGLTKSKAQTLIEAIAQDGLDGIADALKGLAAETTLDDVQLLPPIPAPSKIICIGLNYKTHIAESNHPAPARPMLFARFANSVVGHNQPLVQPRLSSQFDFEGELAVVIGKSARHVARADALGVVAGYACFNDGSIRDYQLHTSQFLPGKAFWKSGSFGPFLVTPDEIPDPSELSLTTRLNGEVMQRATLDDLLFDVPALIEYISGITVLEPGDVIVTGTTGGVGFAREPQVWMRPGDIIEVEISGVGVLTNSIVAEE